MGKASVAARWVMTRLTQPYELPVVGRCPTRGRGTDEVHEGAPQQETVETKLLLNAYQASRFLAYLRL